MMLVSMSFATCYAYGLLGEGVPSIVGGSEARRRRPGMCTVDVETNGKKSTMLDGRERW